MNFDEIQMKLKQYLDTDYNHHINKIMSFSTIKDGIIYCKYNHLSGQFTGAIMEKFIKNKYNMIKNNASDCIGDLNSHDTNYEIKISNGGKNNNKFNFVQLRMNHKCNYILIAYYLNYNNLDNLGEMYIFQLTKENIKPLIIKYGGYAHGTIKRNGKIRIEDLDDENNHKEYVLRPKYGSACWLELLNFRVYNFTNSPLPIEF